MSLKILQISPQNVFPPIDGGKVGIYNIFKFLNSNGAHTDIAFFHNKDEKIDYWDKWRNLGKIHPIVHDTHNSKIKIITAFFQNKSLYLSKHINQKTLQAFEQILVNDDYNAIFCDHTAMAQTGLFLSQKYNLPVFLRLHNIEHFIWEKYGNSLSTLNPLKLFIRQQTQLLKEYELSCLDKFNYLFTINENEKLFIEQVNPKAKVETINIGVDSKTWNYSKEDFVNKSEHTLVIATNYTWKHNVTGLKWFINKVLPIVSEQISEVSLKLYGKGAEKYFKNYHKQVKAIGFVEDITTELKKSQVYIAPLFVGAGIRIKILEAMSIGLPVVATSIAADGIIAHNTNGLFVNDDPYTQAETIIHLLKNKEFLRTSSEQAHLFISQNYNWDKSIQKMITLMKNNIQ